MIAPPRGAALESVVQVCRDALALDPETCPRLSRDKQIQGRRPDESVAEMTEIVLPHHANVHGTVLGGTVMHWIDMAAAITANRHSRRPVVTAAIDEMSFLSPILVGELACLHARLTYVDKSSMEIRVRVEAENLLSGERRHTATAFVTFVALDPVTNRPTPVPPMILETEEDRAEHARGQERRQRRLERRTALRRP